MRPDLYETFRKYKSDKEIFHDMMPLRTREILLVASIYDAFTLEEDGLLSEILFGGYYQLNLSNPPRITNVANTLEASEKLKDRHYDLIIVMSRLGQAGQNEMSRQLRESAPGIPIYLLLNDNVELGILDPRRQEFMLYYDHIFVWNGNSEVFLAMIKFMEDKSNVLNDTKIGLTRVILLVEDSVRYYSRYLPILYSEILKQTRRLSEEKDIDGLTRTLRMRARPKVLLANSFEEAMEYVEQFKDYLLCVISDRKFPVQGVMDSQAGIKLIQAVKSWNPDLPTLLQSSDSDKESLALGLGSRFLNKNSLNLGSELASFFYESLGFGDFVFRDESGAEIARAVSMDDLLEKLNYIPIESIVYHASHNHFSAWLMARGEVQISRMVLKTRPSDFEDPEGLRQYLIHMGDHVQNLKTKGKVMPFMAGRDAEDFDLLRLTEGSLGGKARGVAFVHSLLANLDMEMRFPNINIRIPRSFGVGICEFTSFIERNGLAHVLTEGVDPEEVKRRFLMGSLSPELMGKINELLEVVRCPLAVRSSSLLEDSLSHPFAGLYDTFFLPNNHPDITVRTMQLTEAIKLVYASVYSKDARAYFNAIDYKIEEERMGVLIQELAGHAFGDCFYPHLSGVAQSYNYYPYAYLNPEDGVANLGFGLGKYVVEGGRSFRFCPAYPQLDMQKPFEQLMNSQQRFFALDLSRNTVDLFHGQDATLLDLPVSRGEDDGAMLHCASTWDFNDERIRDGLSEGGRVMNFRNIVKYGQIPLPRLLQSILGIVRESMETPVEIEFAVNLDRDPISGKPTFYLLQIKHQLLGDNACELLPESLQPENTLLISRRCVGNGLVEGLEDVVWVDPVGFDHFSTPSIAQDLEALNEQFAKEKRRYLLMGPGRWGSSDAHLGIPVSWPMISCARVIVEFALPDFQVDASLGSHFFHNVTSLNIGYFTIPYPTGESHLDWEWLRAQPQVTRKGSLVHSRLETPLRVVMDGRKGLAAVFKG